MRTDAGDQLDAAGQLDEVVVRAQLECTALRLGHFLATEDDYRHLGQRAHPADALQEREAVHLRHDEIEQDDGGLKLLGGNNGVVWIIPELELHVRFDREREADGLRHGRLVIHHEDLESGVGHGVRRNVVGGQGIHLAQRA
ncbi:MAG: hypothetical protein HY300_03525 [Verrucomicrobia bacterium]|nr:hypothetical protein [Verrucomicrobiota bacterium]